jgi:hypothetical protein
MQKKLYGEIGTGKGIIFSINQCLAGFKSFSNAVITFLVSFF